MPSIGFLLRGFPRKALAIILALPLAGIALAVAPAPAAMACSMTDHCYAIANDSMGHNNGMTGMIYFTCLHSADSSNFVTNEMWDNTGSGGPLNVYWTEVGVFDGLDPQTTSTDYTRTWFWADFRPGDTNVNIHIPPGFREADFSTVYPAKISFNGGSSKAWSVFGGDSDVFMGTSSSQPNNTTNAYAGTEYTDGQGLRDSGYNNDLAWYDSNNSAHLFAGNAAPWEKGPNASINPSYDHATSTVSWADC